ncbi:transcriptional regulator [Amylibacter kogurei]|uniref:Transcriptional regulator n=1 Tax=Paramylibacter kogurei TaxID=1889778 RepID=A0A2G5K396_9RHOB|nr:MarR family transcriptional regulator [Amylibacter kogurei]PIB23981.1 transcriptional regulator [Amylibacter kogurei]
MDHVDKIVSQWNSERPDLNVEPMELIGRFGRIARYLSDEMARTFVKHGLNSASFDMLATLRRAGTPYALSPSALMASTMVTSGTMTNRIDQLEKAGWVTRRQNPKDKRAFIIALTDEGFALIDRVVGEHVETQERLVSGLDKEEFRTLNDLLRRYLENFQD